MKTPMQEVYDNFNLMSDSEFKAWMLNTDLLEKEKERMCGFAEYTRKCGFLSDQRGLMTTEELYDQTFNTKEK
jgi:hypothetical protein